MLTNIAQGHAEGSNSQAMLQMKQGNPARSPTSLTDIHDEGAYSLTLALADNGTLDSSAAASCESDLENDDRSEQNGKAAPSKGKRDSTKKRGYRKAPQAPKRFKSPYIIFSISKMEEYKKTRGTAKVTAVSRTIAEEWKIISPEERKKWEQSAVQDKMRFQAEKSLYTGPWQIPSKRTRKDPSAPKRPPSAFLFYCKTQRPKLKNENPNLKNTEISVLLGQQWKNAAPEIRQPHIEREEQERELYKTKIAGWREQKEAEESDKKKQRQAITEQFMRGGGVGGFFHAPSFVLPPPGMMPPPMMGYPALLSMQGAKVAAPLPPFPQVSMPFPQASQMPSPQSSQMLVSAQPENSAALSPEEPESAESLEQSYTPEVFQLPPLDYDSTSNNNTNNERQFYPQLFTGDLLLDP